MSFVKDSDSVLDFSVDWGPWLDTDTISSSVWLLPEGAELAIASQSNTATTATVWLSGGVLDKLYRVTNRITTAAGRTDDRTLFIRAVAR